MTTTTLNPFDDETYQFYVLLNQQGQYSLWPEFAAIPAAWTAVFGLQTRQACLDYIDAHWSDIRPFSQSSRADDAVPLAVNAHAAGVSA